MTSNIGRNTQPAVRSARAKLRGLRRTAVWKAAAAVALLGALAAWQSVAVQAFPPHDTERPCCVAVASEPTASPPEAVTGGDSKRVIHWTVQNDPGTFVNNYKKTHAKKVSYVTTSIVVPATGAHPRKLFQASYDGDVIVSDLGDFTNAAVFTIFRGHWVGRNPIPAPPDRPEVWVVTPSQDGSRALSATNDGEILLWDTAPPNGTIIAAVAPSGHPVGGLAFVPPSAPGTQETQFLAGQGDGNMILYNIVQTGAVTKLNPIRPFPHGNAFPVNSVAVTRDGTTAVSGSFDGTVRIWEVATANERAGSPITAHDDMVWRVAISPDETKIASASEDGTVRLFGMNGKPYYFDAARTMEAVKQETDGVMGVAFVSDNKVIYTTGSVFNGMNSEVRVWDIGGLTPPPP